MSTGRLGTADLSATTDTTVYTVPASSIGAFTVSMCNRTGSAILVRLSLAASGTPAASEAIEFDSIVPANGVLERTGLVLEAGRLVVARASAVGISVNVYGYEETV